MKASMKMVPKVVKLNKPIEDEVLPDAVKGLMNPAFKWNPAVATDVQATWRKYGWVPPSELKAKNESRT